MLGLLSLLIGQIFGNSVVPIGTKIASALTGPVPFVLFRFTIATAILFIIFLFCRKRKIKKHEYTDFALLGFFLMINVLFFTVGIAYTTIIMSTLIYSVTPVLVGIGGHFILKEMFTMQKIVGLIVSFAGLLFLTAQSFSGLQKNTFGQPLGNVLICIAMIGYSFYVLHSRNVLHRKDHAPVQTTFLTFAFTAFFLLIVFLAGILSGKVTFTAPPADGTLGFFIVGTGSVLQYLFLQIGVKKTNAFTASLTQYTGPFIAACAAIPLLCEQVTLKLFIGGLLILAGVFITTTYGQLKKIILTNSRHESERVKPQG
jgi:drug/metabolite transporter (DMT)-like permease